MRSDAYRGPHGRVLVRGVDTGCLLAMIDDEMREIGPGPKGCGENSVHTSFSSSTVDPPQPSDSASSGRIFARNDIHPSSVNRPQPGTKTSPNHCVPATTALAKSSGDAASNTGGIHIKPTATYALSRPAAPRQAPSIQAPTALASSRRDSPPQPQSCHRDCGSRHATPRRPRPSHQCRL